MLKDWGLKRIKVVSVLGSKPGIEALLAEHPDIDIYVGSIDENLTEVYFYGILIDGQIRMDILILGWEMLEIDFLEQANCLVAS